VILLPLSVVSSQRPLLRQLQRQPQGLERDLQGGGRHLKGRPEEEALQRGLQEDRASLTGDTHYFLILNGLY